MDRLNRCLLVGLSSLALTSPVMACEHITYQHPYYVAANVGIFEGAFSNTYNDLTDVIAQNISEAVQQRGYTTGLALGYSKLVRDKYFLGAELSGNVNSFNATFQSGASSTAFTDTAQIIHQFDLTFVPGILLSSTIESYLKLGVSYGVIQDTVTSPVGYTPVSTRYTSNVNTYGFAAGLGVKKFLSDTVSLFVEGNYHDYGNVSFSNFQNFSATYNHTSHIYSYAAVIGAAANFG